MPLYPHRVEQTDQSVQTNATIKSKVGLTLNYAIDFAKRFAFTLKPARRSKAMNRASPDDLNHALGQGIKKRKKEQHCRAVNTTEAHRILIFTVCP